MARKPTPEDDASEAAQSDEWSLPPDVAPLGDSDPDAYPDAPLEAAPAPGPAVIDGKTGTVVDSADPSLGKLAVEVRSNVTLGNEVLTPFRKVEVPDNAEARACIAVGHLRLLEDDELLDVDNPEHADYAPF